MRKEEEEVRAWNFDAGLKKVGIGGTIEGLGQMFVHLVM